MSTHNIYFHEEIREVLSEYFIVWSYLKIPWLYAWLCLVGIIICIISQTVNLKCLIKCCRAKSKQFDQGLHCLPFSQHF